MSAALSASAARRLALRAQGLADRRPPAVDRRHLRRVLARLRAVQIDSVNVVARAHYLPFFSRLGGYAPDRLDAFAYRQREVFEYWAHDASLVAVGLQPALRWRMDAARRGATWGSVAAVARDHPAFVQGVLDEVAERGPLLARELSEQGVERRGPWWSWSDGKRALEYLFWTGQVSVAERTPSFERRYDLSERVIPRQVLRIPTPAEADAQRRLVVEAAEALGVATADDLADYWRIPPAAARPRLAEAVEEGALRAVEVEGWGRPAYVAGDPVVPRRVEARALVVPFDPLVWHRPRVQRLFGFRYRIEIYVPAAQRRHGYYVLPFLLGDRLVGRVDLKADRRAGVLRVPAAYAERDVDAGEVAEALARELDAMAGWLGLAAVEVGERGDLAPALRSVTDGG